MPRLRSAILLSWALVSSLAVTDVALAQAAKAAAKHAKPAAKPVKLDANGELLVKLVGTPAPSGLDAKANASLKSIVGKLRSNDVDGATPSS